MTADRFDVIIVGAGIAGLTAGYLLARAGIRTLILERGNAPGSKNCSGGRLYTAILADVLGVDIDSCALERAITREKLTLMTKEDSVTREYQHNRTTTSHSVLRGNLDPWLARLAQQAGAELLCGVVVDGLLQQQGRVTGVSAAGDIIEARVVLLAEGVNALLAHSLGLTQPASTKAVALGIKEVIALPPQQLQARFNLSPGEGTAWLFAGFPSAFARGGGFIYTNKESLSLGIVTHLDVRQNVVETLAHFKRHPLIKPLTEGGRVVEYAAHLVAEGGYRALARLYHDGVLLLGEAAGFSINLGYTVRGMDLAALSAQAAAQTVIRAFEAGDFSQRSLARYRDFLQENHLLTTLRHYRHAPQLLHNTALYQEYPQLAVDLMQALYRIEPGQAESMRRKVLPLLRRFGLLRLLRDVVRGVNAL